MLNLQEVRLRISKGLKKLDQLRGERKVISGQIQFWEGELTGLRQQESELEFESMGGDDLNE